MEDILLKREALTLAQANMQAYFQTHDVKYIAEDGIFRNMGTGEVHKGRAEVGAMLHHTYHIAFDAKAEFFNSIVTEDNAMVEGFFIGWHINTVAGIEATNKEVRVPLCVTYDLVNGLIKEARIYMSLNVLMQQLTT